MDAEDILEAIRSVGEAVLSQDDAHTLTHLLAAVGSAGAGLLQDLLDKRFVADLVIIRDPQ